LIDKLAEWNEKLEELLRQPNSKTINAIDDWDDYFNETRVLLEDQLFRLRTENKAARIQQEKAERMGLPGSGEGFLSD
jgi:adenylate cyclase class IV